MVGDTTNQLTCDTDEPVSRITKVRVKRNSVKRLTRKNRRVDAVLTSILAKTGDEF
jgi:hypothetical protein